LPAVAVVVVAQLVVEAAVLVAARELVVPHILLDSAAAEPVEDQAQPAVMVLADEVHIADFMGL
jgi:hypothetical protein